MAVAGKVKLNMSYYYWLCDIVEVHPEHPTIQALYELEFDPQLAPDWNRYDDGKELINIFCDATGANRKLMTVIKNGPCSMLEMMVALARRCEIEIMHEDELDDRTYVWFEIMLNNLGLSLDHHLTARAIEQVVTRFNERRYNSDGSNGGMFVVHNGRDLRDYELWTQLQWYLREATHDSDI